MSSCCSRSPTSLAPTSRPRCNGGGSPAALAAPPELAAVLGAERFLNEIKISARLDHPHILTLIDSGAADAFLYYVLPYVRGESLRDRLTRDKQLPLCQRS